MRKVFIILFLAIFLTSCIKVTETKQINQLIKDKEGYVDFYQAIKSERVVIAKFGLEMCTGCIEANKILISLMPEYSKSIYFSKVDLFEDRSAEKKYNIKMMPTIIFFDKDGKEFYRLEGVVSKKLIEDKIQSFCWEY